MERFYPELKDIVAEQSKTERYLVLDLDETLIRTQSEEDKSLKKLGIINNSKCLHIRERIYHFILENVDAPGHGDKSEIWGITRPHVNKFLLFCMSYFKGVYIWSAGRREYVQMVVDFLFKDFDRPPIIFTYDDTHERDGEVLKPLEVMYKKFPHMNSSNTLTLDDNEHAVRDNVDNAILIPRYRPSMKLEDFSKNDTTLLQLIKWLKLRQIMEEADVRDLNKEGIFAVPLEAYKAHSRRLKGE